MRKSPRSRVIWRATLTYVGECKARLHYPCGHSRVRDFAAWFPTTGKWGVMHMVQRHLVRGMTVGPCPTCRRLAQARDKDLAMRAARK